ncbi:FkbM family methyltransferase [Picosynechococcus sp. NKBG042902]|uniref:FkbM family methyltransferase n=1 Tax=Picosynechococcus sp. NKBG042902 TaxID=490193 RepID=UPI000694BF19|nr:FkbM family methyltransferase [Picosynechococcus sp. NKBG042902]
MLISTFKKVTILATPPILLNIFRKSKFIFTTREADTDIEINQEIKRLRSIPRKIKCETNLLGKKIISVDAASVLQVYNCFFKQEYCKFTTDLQTPRIIDCGANIGATIYYWKKIFPDAEIIAFEPDPEIFDLLSINCKEFSSTTLIQAGLWTFEGELEFLANGTDGGHIAELAEEVTEDKEKITIPVKRLRDYLQQPCSMLKVDIEGAELEVLLDCKDLLHNVENMFVEYHSFIDKPQNLGKFFSLLEDAGFRIHVLDESTAQQPFISRPVYNAKDLRLDVFAFRE